MRWIAWGAWLAALSVAAGAFGAHGLRGRLAASELELWETAARYLMYGALALVGLGLTARLSGAEARFESAGRLVLAGTLVFSVTVGLLAVGGPGWLGAITPLGGVALIAGLVLFGWRASRASSDT